MCTRACLRLALTLAVASALLTPLGAQSLASVARQEEGRRKTIKEPAKVITDKDLAPVVPPSQADAPASAGSAEPVAASTPDHTSGAEGVSKPEAGAKADDTKNAQAAKDTKASEPKGQAYWAGRLKALQTALTRDQSFAEALQTRVNVLTADAANLDDPLRRAAAAGERQKAVDELDRVTKEVAADRQAITEFQEEARRASVPPGWLR